MAEFKEEYRFPDEEPAEQVDTESALEIEIEDDTPEEDRNRKPADPAKVKALEVEVDELDKYSKDAKDKMIQMKRVWNDERRAKEAAERERQAALEAAQRLLEDNNRMKAMINSGQQEYKDAMKDSAKMQLKMAKKAYKEAYEAGDAEKMMDAQEEIAKAALKEEKIKSFKPQPLQEEKFDVQIQQQYQPAPRLDDKVVEWQESNPWFGQDEEMTASALGLHEKLKRQGVKIGSDEYYATLDKTMRKRFPENFEESEEVLEEQKEDAPKAKPKTVVAPATRSTASKKVKLKTSQVAIAKRLGLTPEQYVRELLKLEA
jgi:colicin import membrane protein